MKHVEAASIVLLPLVFICSYFVSKAPLQFITDSDWSSALTLLVNVKFIRNFIAKIVMQCAKNLPKNRN